MLGFMIHVCRTADDSQPASANTPRQGQQLLAMWQCKLRGLDWLDALVNEGHAIDLGGDGYPLRYTAQAKHVLPKITDGEPPHANPRWLHGEGDIVQGYEHRKTQRKDEAIAACPPDAWLLIEAWDES